MTRQIHVRNSSLIQTLAAVETPGGVTLLSTGGGFGDAALHIPFAARAWLSGVARNERALADIDMTPWHEADLAGVARNERALADIDASKGPRARTEIRGDKWGNRPLDRVRSRAF